MNYAIVDDGKVVDVVKGAKPIRAKDGTQHPANVFELWSAAELAEKLGAWRLLPGPIPPGHRVISVTGHSVDSVAETVTEIYATEPAPPPVVIKPLPPVLETPKGASLPELRAEVAALTTAVNDLRDILEKRGIAS